MDGWMEKETPQGIGGLDEFSGSETHIRTHARLKIKDLFVCIDSHIPRRQIMAFVKMLSMIHTR